MNLTKLGEFGLIEKLRERIKIKHREVKVGIGDDAAVFIPGKDKLLVATSDMLIEDIHFRLQYTPPYSLGWKSLAVNISDIAAMGGLPLYALVSLGLPKNTEVKFVDELYDGLEALANEYNIDIIGGDIASSPKGIIIDISLIGELEHKNPALRSGAKIGDSILVTGTLGDSAAGLQVLQAPKISASQQAQEALKQAHLMPNPKLKEAQAAVKTQLVSAMIDISDGLAGDLRRICEASKVGAKIWTDKIPISSACQQLSEALKKDPLQFALYGGEDYQLLMTAPPEKAAILKETIKRETKTPVHHIGEIVPEQHGITLIKKGKLKNLKDGYNHFRTDPKR